MVVRKQPSPILADANAPSMSTTVCIASGRPRRMASWHNEHLIDQEGRFRAFQSDLVGELGWIELEDEGVGAGGKVGCYFGAAARWLAVQPGFGAADSAQVQGDRTGFGSLEACRDEEDFAPGREGEF